MRYCLDHAWRCQESSTFLESVSHQAAGLSMHSHIALSKAPESHSEARAKVMPTHLQGGWGSVQQDRRTLAVLQACRSWIGRGWAWPCSIEKCAAGGRLQCLTVCTPSCWVCCCLHMHHCLVHGHDTTMYIHVKRWHKEPDVLFKNSYSFVDESFRGPMFNVP